MEAYIEYVYIMLFASLCCFLPLKMQKKTSIFLMLFMMLMCGFRAYDVGTDTHNYVDFINYTYVSDYKWGPFYITLKSVTAIFDNNPTAFLLMMAFLTYIPLIIIIKKWSEYPALSVLLYIIPVAIFFNETFNIARQSIAIVYVLWAAIMVEFHRKKVALALIVIAFFFHPYTFISVVLLLLDKINLTKRKVAFILLTTTLVGIAGALSGIQEMLNLLMIATSDSSSELMVKLGKYGDGYEIESNFSIIGQLSHILPLLALCMLGANEKSMKSVLYKMMLFGCIVTNIFVSVIFCERIASTYTIAQILAVPYMYKTSSRLYKNLILMVLLFTMLLYVYNLKGYSSAPDWTPYHSIFD